MRLDGYTGMLSAQRVPLDSELVAFSGIRAKRDMPQFTAPEDEIVCLGPVFDGIAPGTIVPLAAPVLFVPVDCNDLSYSIDGPISESAIQLQKLMDGMADKIAAWEASLPELPDYAEYAISVEFEPYYGDHDNDFTANTTKLTWTATPKLRDF